MLGLAIKSKVDAFFMSEYDPVVAVATVSTWQRLLGPAPLHLQMSTGNWHALHKQRDGKEVEL